MSTENITPTAEAPQTRGISQATLEQIIDFEQQNISRFAPYRVTLTPADRSRILGTGFKSTGLVALADDLAKNNPNLLPSYLAQNDFHNHVIDFERKKELLAVIEDFARQVTDSMYAAADLAFHDALMIYNFAKEGAKNRVPGFEAVYALLKPYFAKKKQVNKETQAKILRDVEALLKGKKDGKVVIENQTPAVSGGTHVVEDEIEAKKTEIHIGESLTEKQ